MRFYRIEHPTIMSGLVVRYYEMSSVANPGQISASRDGVMIQGAWPILDGSDIEAIKSVLDRAQAQYRHIRGMSPYGERIALPFADDPDCIVQLRRARMVGEDIILEDREIKPESTG